MKNLFTIILLLLFMLFSFIIGIGVGFIISQEEGFSLGDRVAVLEVEGVILDSEPYLESLSKIKKDDGIKAVVLRIDSPGGAVSPSQEIYSEIKKLREKKPVIATLGSVGASGGYYIACSAQRIFANPGTITGSIGVIAQFVSYEDLLKWAKLDVSVIKTGEFKDVGSPFRRMTEADKEYIQQLIDNVYYQFKLAISESRKIDMKEVDKIADGKVYTGEQAKNLKLIDELGTLADAISLAGALSGIKGEPNVSYYPKKKMNLLDLVLSKFNAEILTGGALKGTFGLFYLVDV